MLRFNSNAYDKVYPRPKKEEVVESAVETFTPTTDEQKKEQEEVEEVSQEVEEVSEDDVGDG